MKQRSPSSTTQDHKQQAWKPESVRDWVMWAAYRLYAEGITDPSPARLYEEMERHGSSIFPSQVLPQRNQISRAKHAVTKRCNGNWDKLAAEMHRQLMPNRLSDERDLLFQTIRDRFATEEAKAFSDAVGRDCFCGSLLWFEPYQSTWQLGIHDVETIFTPRSFPATRLGTAEERLIREDISQRIDPTLRIEIDEFLKAKHAAAERDPHALGIGSNNLRAMLERVTKFTEDHTGRSAESGIKPLRLIFRPTDWEHIEGFNNRMMDDPIFRSHAVQEGWVAKVLPDNTGAVPSYVVPMILVTGGDIDPYLVLTQRQGADRVRYLPNTWSTALEENMQGPRWVTRDGLEHQQNGDASLHKCALRGLEEELGIDGLDVDELFLLGLFVEAPTAAIAPIFWVHLKISWDQFVARLPDATDPEARVIAREPLDTENLVRIFLQDTYEPSRDAHRGFVAPGGMVGSKGAWHPGSRARLLAYLLTDTNRHPLSSVIEAFHHHLGDTR